MSLSRDEILGADDLVHEVVECPEWGGSVLVWALNGKERDEFEVSFAGDDDEPADMTNVRARLAVFSIRSEDGRRLFTDGDVEQLGSKSGKALDRVVEVARRLSGIGTKEMEEIVEDFGEAPSAEPTTA